MGFHVSECEHYNCCNCCHMHVITAAKVVSIIMLVLGLLNSLNAFIRGQPVYYGIIGLIIVLLIYGLLVYGIFTERRHFFIPYFVWTAISIVLTIVGVIAFIVAAIQNKNDGFFKDNVCGKDNDHCKTWYTVYAISWSISIVIMLWFFHVILRCYRYLCSCCGHGHC